MQSLLKVVSLDEINRYESNESRVLHITSQNSHLGITRALLERGASRRQLYHRNRSPLSDTENYQMHKECINFVIGYVNAKNIMIFRAQFVLTQLKQVSIDVSIIAMRNWIPINTLKMSDKDGSSSLETPFISLNNSITIDG